MDAILKDSIDQINETGAKQDTAEAILGNTEVLLANGSENKGMINQGVYLAAFTGAKTLLDINGKGGLVLATILGPHTTPGNTSFIKITVDGKVYLLMNRKNTHSSSNRYIGLALYACGFGKGVPSGTNITHPIFAGDLTTSRAQSVVVSGTISAGEHSINMDTSRGFEHVLKNPLLFEQSLKVEVSQGYSADLYSQFIYYLD